MRNLVLYQLLSLDGVAEEPSDWMSDGVGDDLVANLGRVIGRQSTVLLGRRTYDEWAEQWPTSTFQPFADFINATPKHVLTSSEPATAWDNTVLVSEPAEQHVAALKREDGGDIGIHGSITLAQSLLRAGHVDELRLVIGSTLAGRGRRLFTDDLPLQRFDLVEDARTPGGSLLLGYVRATAADG